MRVRIPLFILLGVMAVANAARATVYSPWILSEHTADMRDAQRFAADPRWADLHGQEKALAVWRYLTDPATGTWHYADTSEGADPNWESRIVKDPIKTLNVYGYAVCTVHACMLEGLYEALGFGVRQMEFGGYHRTAEVEWDRAWHYLDVDERAYLVDSADRVVSVTEAVSRPEWWERSARLVSPFYPQNGGVRGISELAKHGPGEAHWHWRTLGHTMDFVLRPGESLIRYWKGQGRWRVDPSWTSDVQRKALETAPAGPKTDRGISVNNTYGNGLWRYQPKLSSRYRDFAEGVSLFENVRQDTRGLRLAKAGTGWAEWRVRTPYIIAGKPNDLSTPDDDRGAAVVGFAGTGEIGIRVWTDQSKRWETVAPLAPVKGAQHFDLTRWVAGSYEYRVRLLLRGSQWSARLTSLSLDTWTQLAPASLPRLARGFTTLSFVWGDARGEATEIFSLEPNFSDPEDLKRSGVRLEGEYHADNAAARVTGPVLLKVTALPGTKLRRLHVGGAFNAHHGEAKRPDRILFSAQPEIGWRLLHQERPPEWVQHWYYNQEADLELGQPVPAVWIKLDPAVAVNGLRVYAHCERGSAEQSGPIEITHIYRAGGKERTESFRFSKPQQYRIFCADHPENVLVKMAAPSVKAGNRGRE